MARKREEKANRNASHNNAKENQSNTTRNQTEPKFVSLKQQLSAMGLALREIPGDGNCLFGALADQLDGTPRTHYKHRQDVVAYMRNHRCDFEPFMEDDVPFDRHLSNLAELGTYGGNECIVAFARFHKVKVVIHQLNTPLWQIDGVEGCTSLKELHISYHNGDHYNSVRKLKDCSSQPPNIKLTVKETITQEKKSYDDSSHTCLYDKDEASALVGIEKENYPLIEEVIRENHEEVFKHSDNESNESFDAIANMLVNTSTESKPECGLWGPEGTGSRILGIDLDHDAQRGKNNTRNNTAKIEKLEERLKQRHISNSKRKELRKQLRKHQSNERKRKSNDCDEALHETATNHWKQGGESSPEVIIVNDIACLSI